MMAWRSRRGRGLVLLRALVGVLFLAVAGFPAMAQKAVTPDTHDETKAHVNAGTVGIVSSGVGGIEPHVALDLASALDREGELRIVGILGQTAIEDITDTLYLGGVDIGLMQTDVLNFVRRNELHFDLTDRLAYIAKLYSREFHLLVRNDITSLDALSGRKVNIGPEGSGSFMTATTVFASLGVEVDATHDNPALALDRLRRGEIAGLAFTAAKPSALLAQLRAEDGLRLLPVPYAPRLQEAYVPATLEASEYGALVPGGDIGTIAVGTMLAGYDWSDDNKRLADVTRFIEAFFENFDALLKPPHHPKWNEVNLKATLPGWRRMEPAKEWLEKAATSTATRDAGSGGEGWLADANGSPRRLSSAERRKLIAEIRGKRKPPAASGAVDTQPKPAARKAIARPKPGGVEQGASSR